METISGHFLGGLPPGEPPGLPPGLVATWFQGEGYKAMSNFVTLRHFLGAGQDGDDLGALLRRSTTW